MLNLCKRNYTLYEFSVLVSYDLSLNSYKGRLTFNSHRMKQNWVVFVKICDANNSIFYMNVLLWMLMKWDKAWIPFLGIIIVLLFDNSSFLRERRIHLCIVYISLLAMSILDLYNKSCYLRKDPYNTQILMKKLSLARIKNIKVKVNPYQFI